MKNKLILLLCMLLLVGCETKKYTIEDVEDYIENNIGIKNYKIIESTRVKDDEGYQDTIYFVDTSLKDGTEITFHIVDDHHWGMEAETNLLKDDYNEAIFEVLKDRINLDSYDLVYESDYNELYSGKLITSYSTLDDLDTHLNLLSCLQVEIQQYASLSIPYIIEYDHPLRSVTDYIIDQGDVTGVTDSISLDHKEAYCNYLMVALDYHYQEAIEDCIVHSINIDSFIKNQKGEINRLEDGYTYPYMISSPYYYGISFGNLYEIIREEGIAVNGDFWHYSYSYNGHSYEISYDFIDNLYDGNKGYYYLVDNVPVKMDRYFYNHFETDQIEEITGIQLEEKRLSKGV